MKLLIAIPCAGGMITTGCMTSLLQTWAQLPPEIECEIYTLSTESLINRGRNTCAKYAIDGRFDKLLFIDSDLIFTYADIKRLLDSDKLVVGGTYPLKNFPITVNFNPLDEHADLFGKDRQQDNYMEWVRKYADDNGEAEVRHIPTGFMLIDMRVLAKLSHTVNWYQNFNPDLKTTTMYFEFFPTGVVNHELLSEDWYFCKLARDAGFKIYLQTRSVCAHIGNYAYGLGHHIIRGQPPLIK